MDTVVEHRTNDIGHDPALVLQFARAAAKPRGKACVYLPGGSNVAEGWVPLTRAVSEGRPFFVDTHPNTEGDRVGAKLTVMPPWEPERASRKGPAPRLPSALVLVHPSQMAPVDRP
jgi:hypothetical protein